jgi:hypothetical protein
MPRLALDAVTINDSDDGALPIHQMGGATITTGQLAVTTTAQVLIASNTKRFSVVITNTGASTVFLGTSSVSTANGHALPSGNSISFRSSTAIYAIAAATGNTITFCEEAL